MPQVPSNDDGNVDGLVHRIASPAEHGGAHREQDQAHLSSPKKFPLQDNQLTVDIFAISPRRKKRMRPCGAKFGRPNSRRLCVAKNLIFHCRSPIR